MFCKTMHHLANTLNRTYKVWVSNRDFNCGKITTDEEFSGNVKVLSRVNRIRQEDYIFARRLLSWQYKSEWAWKSSMSGIDEY